MLLYKCFVEKILEKREMWLLLREGESVLAGEEGNFSVPIWSSREAAEGECDGDWEGSVAECVYLCDFLESYVPVYLKNDLDVFVDMHNGVGIQVNLSQFSDDLKKGALERGFEWTELSPEQSAERQDDREFSEFLEKVILDRGIWTVFNGDKIVCLSDEEGEWFPIWSCKEGAAADCCGEWEDCHPELIPVSDFMSSWLPYLMEFQAGASVCAAGDGCFKIDFEGLGKAIMHEAERQGISEEELQYEDADFMRFLWTIVNNGKVWILCNDDRIVTVSNDMGDSVPVWSSREDAAGECTDEWAGCNAESVSLSELMTEWLPDLEDKKLGIFVISKTGEGINFMASEFEAELAAEIGRQEPKSQILRRNRRRKESKSPTDVLN